MLLESFTWQHGVIRVFHGEMADEREGVAASHLPPSLLSSARPKWRARLLLPNTANSASPDSETTPIPPNSNFCLRVWGHLTLHPIPYMLTPVLGDVGLRRRNLRKKAASLVR